MHCTQHGFHDRNVQYMESFTAAGLSLRVQLKATFTIGSWLFKLERRIIWWRGECCLTCEWRPSHHTQPLSVCWVTTPGQCSCEGHTRTCERVHTHKHARTHTHNQYTSRMTPMLSRSPDWSHRHRKRKSRTLKLVWNVTWDKRRVVGLSSLKAPQFGNHCPSLANVSVSHLATPS